MVDELPDKLSAQLATLARAPPPDAADWIYKIKFAGYRMLPPMHERLDTGNWHWNDYARAARSLTAAMATLGYTLRGAESTAANCARRCKITA